MKKYSKVSFGLILTYGLSLTGCSQTTTAKEGSQQELVQVTGKINGLSFVASPKPVMTQEVNKVMQVNANWVSLMPYGFVRNADSPVVHYNSERQWRGEKIDGINAVTDTFRKQGIHVMIKPQLWIGHNNFTGNLKMKSSANWQTFETSYEKYILDFAKAAQETGCEMFCIGTELNSFVISRPAFWDTLINKVRIVFHGKITYAENWDSFENIPFWSKLDFIGIDAYFPLSDKEIFTTAEIEKGWRKYKKLIREFSTKERKPILFTEFGYRSSLYAAKEPWTELNNEFCLANQQSALEALFNSFWNEQWFAGGFLWKWYDNAMTGGETNTDYTPQNKPAEELIRVVYGKH
ncbi:MAG: hypothetical protein U0X40_06680 [Ferruginibacter sp.]